MKKILILCYTVLIAAFILPPFFGIGIGAFTL